MHIYSHNLCFIFYYVLLIDFRINKVVPTFKQIFKLFETIFRQMDTIKTTIILF